VYGNGLSGNVLPEEEKWRILWGSFAHFCSGYHGHGKTQNMCVWLVCTTFVRNIFRPDADTKGPDKSLALYRKQATGLKKVFTLHIPPPRAPHTYDFVLTSLTHPRKILLVVPQT
jgi:hypothetical protein